MSTPSIEERRLGRDVVLPQVDGELLVTASGDLQTVAGRPNLRAAIRRRVITQPGELLHRPTYGAGLPGYVERPSTASTRARLATDIRRQCLADPRVSECRASSSIGTPGDSEATEAITVDLSVTVRGDDAADQMTLTYAE